MSIVDDILGLKSELNAVILSHNYQRGEVQDIADFVGDSLDLSRKAAVTDADVIVFCGVHFMAETAAILSPDKTVIMPDPGAGCPMADMINDEQLRGQKALYPDAAVVTYVNSSAAVKAESDWCCTSANAVRVVEAVDSDKILFVPDKYLGAYVAAQSKKEFILWNGFCPTHARIIAEDVSARRQEHPDAVVIVHPECRPEVIAGADKVLSTGGMITFAKETTAKEIIVGTEVGIIYRLKKENPDKDFYPVSDLAVCPNMKKTDLHVMLTAMQEMTNVITVPEDIATRARRAIDRMLSV
ncbi:MAG: quinolinate synthase NadA [Actinomycetota bacterium]